MTAIRAQYRPRDFRGLFMTKLSIPSRRANGFTLIVILVVIVILGILAALIVPRVMDRPDTAPYTASRSVADVNNGDIMIYRPTNCKHPIDDLCLSRHD